MMQHDQDENRIDLRDYDQLHQSNFVENSAEPINNLDHQPIEGVII